MDEIVKEVLEDYSFDPLVAPQLSVFLRRYTTRVLSIYYTIRPLDAPNKQDPDPYLEAAISIARNESRLGRPDEVENAGAALAARLSELRPTALRCFDATSGNVTDPKLR